MLLFLLLLLVGPTSYSLWRTAGADFKITPGTRARVGLSIFFIFTSIGHFIKAEEMSAMLRVLFYTASRLSISRAYWRSSEP